MGTQLADLLAAGQSIWLDNIRRNMFASGDLKKLIAGGLRGMTSNPTIFEKAIGAGNDYDEQLRELIGKESDPNHLFEALAIDDIRHACDEFRSLYDSTNGADGFVSLEVSPLLAADTKGTADAAERLWKMVDRPNVMIKIPATPEGIPAITETIAKKINVNVTLIFSLETYEAVANAYIAGLEKLDAAGGDLSGVASVASVFVSRIDTAVDKLLDEKIIKGQKLEGLLGKTGIANLRLIYARFRKLFENERFTKLSAKGAHPQRPLWASTGTKNPKYSDLMYVETLVAPHTVNTVPPATLDALLDHGKITPDTAQEDLDGAHATIDALGKAQISLFDVTQKLQVEGVKSFADSYNSMLQTITDKQKRLESGSEKVAAHLGKAEAGLEPALDTLAASEFLAKLWKRDASPWSSDPADAAAIKNALGWLDFPEVVLHQHAAEYAKLARECARTFRDVVVLGIGGSSLAPNVLRAIFGKTAGFPELHVLDSIDPDEIRALERRLDLPSTLFIVSSKSGKTIETEALCRYFYGRVAKSVGSDYAGRQFLAITAPGTQLGTEAREANFFRTWENDPQIGGNFSALSHFGMLPAALAGYDVAAILDRGLDVLQSNARATAPKDAPAVRFGAAIATLARAGRDKLTIVTHPSVAAFGTWAEQLVAEATGKDGRGIVPIEGEPLGDPLEYGDDRAFVYVGAGLPDATAPEGTQTDAEIRQRLTALADAGHPVLTLTMTGLADVGAQFAFWEIATVTASALLGVNAFDRPNVCESQANADRLLAEFRRTGAFPQAGGTDVPASGVTALAGSRGGATDSLEAALAAVLAGVRTGDYVAFTAFVERSPENEAKLRKARLAVRRACKVATTVSFGPRFLHSTGQLHKGGPASGVFFQLTYETPVSADLAVPGMASFATLSRAQALGDFAALDRHARRGVRAHLTSPAALDTFVRAIEDALSAKI